MSVFHNIYSLTFIILCNNFETELCYVQCGAIVYYEKC